MVMPVYPVFVQCVWDLKKTLIENWWIRILKIDECRFIFAWYKRFEVSKKKIEYQRDLAHGICMNLSSWSMGNERFCKILSFITLESVMSLKIHCHINCNIKN